MCQLSGRPETRGDAGEHVTPGEIVSSTKKFHVVCGKATYLRLESVQVEGRKKVSALEFANGAHLIPGERFE
jgi:methionyl-tRNA formyltransferase